MKKPVKNFLEWSVFAASALLVAATIGYLAWSAVTHDSGEPDLRVTTGRVLARGGVYVVPIVVRNLGNETAEQVRVEVTLRRGETEVERAQLDLMFVPRSSKRDGWVTFMKDPRGLTIDARAVGYERP
jgi:uncharacterized protein (TIGR02588 family)